MRALPPRTTCQNMASPGVPFLGIFGGSHWHPAQTANLPRRFIRQAADIRPALFPFPFPFPFPAAVLALSWFGYRFLTARAAWTPLGSWGRRPLPQPLDPGASLQAWRLHPRFLLSSSRSLRLTRLVAPALSRPRLFLARRACRAARSDQCRGINFSTGAPAGIRAMVF